MVVLVSIVAGLLTLSLLLPGVTIGYWDRDEAEYAGVAHEMAVSHDYLVPRLFHRLYPDKPPLSEWLSAFSYGLLGETEFAGRLPHVLLVVGSVILLLLLGNRLLGLRKAFFASSSFGSSLLLLIYGRLMVTDSALLFFTLLSILALVYLLEDVPSPWPLFLGGLGLGLAILSKGPIAYLAPALFSMGYLVASRERRGRVWWRVLALFLLATVLAAPWFLLADLVTSGQSLKPFVLHENIFRFLHPMDEHQGPIFYFALVLLFGVFPWSGALVGLFRRNRVGRGPYRAGLLAWGTGVLVFFSFSATKLPHYLLPALPAFALLMADGSSFDNLRHWRIFSWITASVACLLFLEVLLAACRWNLPGLAGRVLYPFGIVAVLSLSLPLLSGGRTRRLVMPVAFSSAAVIAGMVPHSLDAARCLPRLGAQARHLKRRGEPVGSLKLDEPALQYYEGCDSPRQWATPAEAISGVLFSPTGSCLIWLDSAEAVTFARDRRVTIRILGQGYNLIDPTAQGYLQLVRVSKR